MGISYLGVAVATSSFNCSLLLGGGYRFLLGALCRWPSDVSMVITFNAVASDYLPNIGRYLYPNPT
jgi:hypothetical protein